MKVRSFTVIIMICMLISHYSFIIYAADETGSPEITSEYAILLETDRGQAIYKKNPDRKINSYVTAIAMTAIMALEATDRPPMVTISSIIDQTAFKTVDIKAGEKYSFDDLLYVMLMKSAPDIAVIIADSIFTDIYGFIDMMDAKAVSLGMTNTSFSMIQGSNLMMTSMTTMDDMAKLFMYCLNNSTFNKIFKTKIFMWPMVESKSQIISNSNNLIWRYENITGGMKSPYKIHANTFSVTTATIDDLNLLCILGDGNLDENDSDTETLINYAEDNFRKGILVAKNQTITEVDVSGTILKLSSDADIYYTYPIGQYFVDDVTYTIHDKIEPPILRNVSIGIATYHLMDGTLINVTLYPDADILPKAGLADKILTALKEHKDLLNVIYFFLALEFLLIIHKIASLIKKHIDHRS